MKNNITLSSSDRELFGITIKQNTKDQFLSISDLQQAYEVGRFEHGWREQRTTDIMQTQAFKERAFYILENQGVITVDFPTFIEMIEKDGITRVLKNLGVYKTTGARQTKQTFANPYIWILLAMELNPMIYAKVVIWLTDTLIFDRIEAGSEYLPMNTAISGIVKDPQYYIYAMEINKKVFGVHKNGIRNLASAKELRKIADIEKFVIQAINVGLVKGHEDILKVITSFN